MRRPHVASHSKLVTLNPWLPARSAIHVFRLPCRWEVPPGYAPAGGSAGSANSDWAAATDPSSGKSYYYNSKTGVTSWEVPPGYNVGGSGGAAGGAVKEEAVGSSARCRGGAG
jgi:hypothetical protein